MKSEQKLKNRKTLIQTMLLIHYFWFESMKDGQKCVIFLRPVDNYVGESGSRCSQSFRSNRTILTETAIKTNQKYHTIGIYFSDKKQWTLPAITSDSFQIFVNKLREAK